MQNALVGKLDLQLTPTTPLVHPIDYFRQPKIWWPKSKFQKLEWKIISMGHTNFLAKVELKWVQDACVPHSLHKDLQPTLSISIIQKG